jgi:hypothetical protein
MLLPMLITYASLQLMSGFHPTYRYIKRDHRHYCYQKFENERKAENSPNQEAKDSDNAENDAVNLLSNSPQ